MPRQDSCPSVTDAITTRLALQVPSAAATAVAATTAAVAGGALRVADIIRPEDWQFTEVKVAPIYSYGLHSCGLNTGSLQRPRSRLG